MYNHVLFYNNQVYIFHNWNCADRMLDISWLEELPWYFWTKSPKDVGLMLRSSKRWCSLRPASKTGSSFAFVAIKKLYFMPFFRKNRFTLNIRYVYRTQREEYVILYSLPGPHLRWSKMPKRRTWSVPGRLIGSSFVLIILLRQSRFLVDWLVWFFTEIDDFDRADFGKHGDQPGFHGGHERV